MKTSLRIAAIALAAAIGSGAAADEPVREGELATIAYSVADDRTYSPHSSLSSRVPQIAVSATFAPGAASLRPSASTEARRRGNLVSVAAVPKPSGGAMLLCAVVVLAFIARRKTRPVTD